MKVRISFACLYLVSLSTLSGCTINPSLDRNVLRLTEPCASSECFNGSLKIKGGISIDEFQYALIGAGYNPKGIGEGIGRSGRKTVSLLSFGRGGDYVLLSQDGSIGDTWSIKVSRQNEL